MTTRAHELIGLALYLDGIVSRCRVRRALGSCAICAGDAHTAQSFARAALLSTLRKQWLRLEYCPPVSTCATLSKTS
jgi:hypothetical protein